MPYPGLDVGRSGDLEGGLAGVVTTTIIFEGPKTSLPRGAQLDPNGNGSVAAPVVWVEHGHTCLCKALHGQTKLSDILVTFSKTC